MSRVLLVRTDPGVQRVAVAVLRGDLGLPWAVQADLVLRGPDGGTLGELLAGAVDAVRFVLGLGVRTVSARCTGSLDDDHGVLNATLIFEHEVGASITVSRIATPGLDEARLRVMGNEGVLAADLTRPAVLIDGGARLLAYGPTAVEPVLEPADADAVAGVVDAIRKSIAENAVIHLEGI
ncbi:Gfo/Idh/MocA family protein [Microlunatus parietis]|uniref:Putative dehydrogenase n=1 Tax=Microlunatus parietis TaxID=682979 RepID=A0A7Y9ID19_9ACTN|nr:hypothetical protein [Microlunatus parietis]NYE74485.1 putative dehydrogenase [Microlunatus parietis]